MDDMSGANSCPHSLLEGEKQTVYETANEHPDIKHRKLAYKMQNEGTCFVSPSSVYRLLKARGLIKERETQREESVPDSRDDGPDEPNEQWHTDVTYIKVDGSWAKLVSFLDGCSRKIVHWRLSYSLSALQVSRVYDEALKKEGLLKADEKPKVVSDNGSRFVGSDMAGFLDDLGVHHRTIPVGHPESNGKIEVFHKTLKYENVYLKPRYETLLEARDDIGTFIDHYNKDRLHQGINYVTPKQKHQGNAEDIVEQREQKHEEAQKRRKRINQQRSKSGKTKERFEESV
jgi:transposase InsO family protein